jgi:sugar phosphate permease
MSVNDVASPPSGAGGNVRWGIATLLCVGTVINYFDRVNLSVASTGIMSEFHLTKTEYGFLLSSFLWSYSLMQIPVGALLDRYGVKWPVRISAILWGMASLITAAASGLGMIKLSRILLGISEAPAFPANAKATGYWFPLRERGAATSLFDAAAKFSNVLGLPAISLVVAWYGWRSGFVATAIVSMAFAVVFWIVYRDPGDMPRLSRAEMAYITTGGAQEPGTAPADAGADILFFLRQRKVWGLLIGFSAYNYTIYLFLTWLPGYLQQQLGVTVLKSGIFLVVPWLVATVTDVAIGGFFVDYLIRRGGEPTRVRKTVVTIGLLLGVTAAGAAFTRDPVVAVAWLTVSLAGLAFAAPVFWSIPALIAPRGTVGTLSGIINFSGQLAAAAAPVIAGYIADHGGFGPNFLLTGVLLVIGILAFVFMTGPLERIVMPGANLVAAPSEEGRSAR